MLICKSASFNHMQLGLGFADSDFTRVSGGVLVRFRKMNDYQIRPTRSFADRRALRPGPKRHELRVAGVQKHNHWMDTLGRLRVAQQRHDRLSLWAQDVAKRRGNNVAAVALANKHARIIWAMLKNKEDYRMTAA